MHNTIAAVGIPNASPLEISVALRDLHVSHTVVVRDGFRMNTFRQDGLAVEQPAWPYVVGGIRNIQAVQPGPGAVLLICDAAAALAQTNLPVFAEGSLSERLQNALDLAVSSPFPADWKFEVRELSMHEYVEQISPPSYLDKFLTACCKINPYSDRKIVQAESIRYLNGGPVGKARSLLASNLKFHPVRELVLSERGQLMRKAVADVKAGIPMSVVTAQTGFADFEINYFPASAAKTEREGK